ncbi:MAG TPA: sigma-70 family RNA polymerase sigma factor [Pyrinomonadaceae bacterium]|nr:sigma-70 family RNA polymerase sigma factor [Pyrinomonadaceae bacterium]
MPTMAFNEEALTHIDALFGYAMTLTRDKTEAEDLVQETYVRGARAANQLAAESNVKSWLFVVMRNAWLNQLRRQNKGPRFVGLEDEESIDALLPAEESTNPQVVYLRKVERTEIRTALESLPSAYREIVVLRDIEGLSYQEIATVLDCPAGTVMSRLARAREKLRCILNARAVHTRLKAV